MSKFKVGDRVLAVDNVGMYKTPAPGTVISVYSKFSHPYRVHFDGSGYKLWSNVAGLLREKHPVIVITTDGKTTTATKRLNGKVLGAATAKCNPGDKFDFDTGAALAFARLVGAEVKFADAPETEKPWPKKLVCVEANKYPEDFCIGCVYPTEQTCEGFGLIRIKDGSHWGVCKTSDAEFRISGFPHYARFIPLVED